MQIQMPSTFYNGGGNVTVIFDEPEECPICHHAIKPEPLASRAYTNQGGKNYFAAILLCKHCYNCFIINFATDSIGSGNYRAKGEYEIAPVKYVEGSFDPFIKEISPDFVEIYNQAMAAESYGLDQISGIGLRKALEFLIKDFVILKNPGDQTSIEKMPLQQCIEKYIEDRYLKAAASRAVWLGNDQTHYVQKFENNDISDLKKLITATVHWISMLHITEEAEAMEPIK